MESNNRKLLVRTVKIIGFFAIVGIFYFTLRGQDWSALRSINRQSLVLASVLIVLAHLLSGLQYYVSLRIMGCKLAPSDVFFFPYMQSLWGVIIPLQGASLFAVFYLKKRYSFHMTQSVAMILFLYLFNVVFGGLAGVTYSFCAENFSATLFAFSLVGVFFPLFLYGVNLLLLKHSTALPLPEHIREIIVSFFKSFDILLANVRKIVILLFFQIVRQICWGAAFVILARRLEPDVSFLWGYLVVVSQEISLILKFTPGNLGMSEAVSAFVSHLAGTPAAIGLIVAAIGNLLSLTQVLVFGGIGNFMALKNAGGIKGFWTRAMHTAPPDGGDSETDPE